MILTLVAFTLIAYLIGAIPFAVVTSRLLGLTDPRSYGSGNPGATNVLRSGNKLAAALTLLGDAGKGLVAVWVMARWGSNAPVAIALAGLGAFIGHVFPVTLGFRGGKGVATALGVIAAWGGGVVTICVAVWLMMATLTGYSSAAAIIAAIVAPIAAHQLIGSTAITLACLVMSVLLIWRHAENIQRLLSGTERKIGEKKDP